VGLHCEEGDTLADAVTLDYPRPGDLLAVPVTGAYTYSLANNYNGIPRAAILLCEDGAARPAVRRETTADLLSRLHP
jgi:diaminopimelate decarboxylase